MTGRPVPSRLPDVLHLAAVACVLVLLVSIFREPLGFLRHELVPPPAGFLMQVTAEPVEGTVEVDGQVRGETPFFGNVRCQPEDSVSIRVTAPGFRPWERQLECRTGGTLRATARLER